MAILAYRNMRILLFVLSLSIFIGFLCSSFTKKEKVWHSGLHVPGIVFLDEKTGIDQTEVTNFAWLEYLYWLSRVYGKESKEYTSQLPDTTLWLKQDSIYHSNADHYLRHPAFRNYPVVCVSYEQAEKFCEWRSDMVFAYFLIKKGEVTWERVAVKDPDSLITIDRYRKGKVLGLKSNPTINRFPDYYLPDSYVYYKAEGYIKYFLEEQSKKKRNALTTSVSSNRTTPAEVTYGPARTKGKFVYHFWTNTSEWLAGGEVVYGENWMGYTTNITDSQSFENKKAHPGVGFRCAFKWVE